MQEGVYGAMRCNSTRRFIVNFYITIQQICGPKVGNSTITNGWIEKETYGDEIKVMV